MSFQLDNLAEAGAIYKRHYAACTPGVTVFKQNIMVGTSRAFLKTFTVYDKIRDDNGLSKVRVVIDVPTWAQDSSGKPLGSSKADLTLFLPNFGSPNEREYLVQALAHALSNESLLLSAARDLELDSFLSNN